jgi:hypothetical protein
VIYVCSYEDCSNYGVERQLSEDANGRLEAEDARRCPGIANNKICGRLLDRLTEELDPMHIPSAQPLEPEPQESQSISSSIRAERHSRLLASDWTQLADSPLTKAQIAAAAKYRQALRDFPADVDDPDLDALVWPEIPEFLR